MSSQIELIIKTAEKYIGEKESPPNSNNVIFNTRFYDHPVSGAAYPWCCAFIWCLFRDIIAPELFCGGNKTASCTTLMNYAKANGLFHTTGFCRGDLALFNWHGNKNAAQHVGLITGFISGGVQTIEGNTSVGNDSDGGEVMRRTRGCGTIIGVYRPNYEEDEEMITQEQFEAMYKLMMDKQANAAANPNFAPAEYDAAVKAGITDGSCPQSPATRQEVAVMVYRGMRN